MIPLLLMFLAVLATAGRVLGLMLASVVVGWFLGYQAVKSKAFENVFIAAIEVFESVPVISFFPIVLALFVLGVGGPLGVELAADFLVFTEPDYDQDNDYSQDYECLQHICPEGL